MAVEGSATPEEIVSAVKKVGYGAEPAGAESVKKAENNELNDTEMPKLKARLLSSILFLSMLMYFSMGHTMLGLPLPSMLENNFTAVGLIQLLLSAAVMVINQKFFISGFKAVLNRSPNMDTLVSLGASASFLYSVYALFAMTEAQMNGNQAAAMSFMHELYFESAAMIFTLISVGKMLEAHSKGKTTDALKKLIKLTPQTAVVIKNGVQTQVNISEVKAGDAFVLRPGQSVPVDGVVTDGESAIDESSLTGESIPVDKTAGDTVSAGTINQSGFIVCRATRVGEETTLSQIIKTVSDANATKAPIAKTADKVSCVFVPAVILIAVITFAVWMLTGQTVGFSLARAVSVLVISCPCALGLATPVAVMVGSGVGAKHGILFKTAASIEETGKVKIVVLDKTGTVTSGKPNVTDIIPETGFSETQLLTLAYSLESKSEHPLARAIIAEGDTMNVRAFDIISFKATPGGGVSGEADGATVAGGNLNFIKSFCDVKPDINIKLLNLSKQGKTPLCFAKNGVLVGVIAIADTVKTESENAVKELKDTGLRVVMLTGDNENTARAVGQKIGVDEVIAEVLPNGKDAVIKELQQNGKVLMAGDGINDAPALTRADIGMAVGAGSDIAIDAADVVLVKSRLTDVPAAIKISRATYRVIRQNLFWAFIYNVIGIPLAAGVWYPVFGLLLNPMFGAAAMSLSSFCVVMNALRLNRIKIKKIVNDKQIDLKPIKESEKMEKLFKIEGMMCPHCEARVKSAIEAMPEVESAAVSHESGTAVVTLKTDVDDAAVKAVIEAQGYKVIE